MNVQALNTKINALALAFAVAVSIVVVSASAGAGEKGREDPAQAVLEERLRHHCKPLVGEWLMSEGMSDPGIRARAADCYLAHARLRIMDVDWDLDLTDTSISEVPGKILESRTGISLDFYDRLAGRALASPPSGLSAGQVLKMPTISTGGEEVK